MNRQAVWRCVVSGALLLVATAGVTQAQKSGDWRKEWKGVKISPEPAAMRDIPCAATPETQRIIWTGDNSNDPGYQSKQILRVLVLDDVANQGKESIPLPEREIAWGGSDPDKARQSGDFSSTLQDQFRYLTGPAKRKDWEKWNTGRKRQGSSQFLESRVTPGFGILRYAILWKHEQIETRSVGEGQDRQSGTRTQLRYGVSTFTVGYRPTEERVDPCTGKRVPLQPTATP